MITITLTPTHKKRLTVILLIIIGIAVTVGLALAAFKENLVYFLSPSEIIAGKAPKNQAFRMGGMVNKGSIKRATDSLLVRFEVTDFIKTVPVHYTGILPDLFREEQGVVAIGKLQADGTFVASEVLAKHDEKYVAPEITKSLPPEVLSSLKAGHTKTVKPQ